MHVSQDKAKRTKSIFSFRCVFHWRAAVIEIMLEGS